MQDALLLATILLGAAVIAVPLAARLGFGSVLGYLLAGVAIGPLIGAEATDLQHIAEFGVVMMLFLIGLELDPRALWGMRHRLLGLCGLQVSLTTLLLMAGFMALGQPWQTALAIGWIFALSSTAIVLQTLAEKGLMQTSGGRNTFSVLLTQDIAVIPMLALIPLLAIRSPVTVQPDGSMQVGADAHAEPHGMSLVEGLPAWGVTLVTIGAVAAVILVGIFLTRPVFRYIHQSRLREMYTALALLIVVSIATLMGMVGLSAALGTFLAGVVLANSEFRHELESDLQPFKGLLLGLFFITVGAGINFDVLASDPARIIGLTAGMMLIKGAVLYGLARLFKLDTRARWLFTLGLAQAGEFGFVLIAFSLSVGVLGGMLAGELQLIVALSMMITPLLFILFDVLSRRLDRSAHKDAPSDDIDEKGTVIIAGIGRFGQIVNRLVKSSGFSTVVLDHNLQTIQLMRTFGTKGFFGDPTRPDILHAAGIEEAKVLVVALDSKESAVKLVRYARSQRPDLHIVARARDRVHVYELYAAGANDIVRELFDSSLRAGRYVLENLGLSEFEASEAETAFYHVDRHLLRELAEVWDPDIPIRDNPAYVERARSAERELETRLAETLDEVDRERPRPSDSPKRRASD